MYDHESNWLSQEIAKWYKTQQESVDPIDRQTGWAESVMPGLDGRLQSHHHNWLWFWLSQFVDHPDQQNHIGFSTI